MTGIWKGAVTGLVAGAILFSAVEALKSDTVDESGKPFAKQNWLQANGDIGNTRYSELSQINAENVKNLGLAWVSDKFEDAGTSRVTPIVKDGVMFVSGGAKVYAMDATSGKVLWKAETAAIDGVRTPGGGMGQLRGTPNREGMAVGEGKVFVATTDAQMMAFDEKTGKLLWRRLAGEDLTAAKKAGISAAPTYINGVIYTCITFGEARYIGRFLALDAKDGHQIWRWDSVPGPGEPGHETWSQTNEAWKMGGADAWMPPIVDTELGMVYYGTGNPSPNRQAAESRPGNNLYSSTVIALDMKTGKLRWFYQTVHHDLWEGDLGTPLVAYDAEVNGVKRKALACLRMDGTLFLLDRATGKPVWPTEERPVRQNPLMKTAATQPFPVGRKSITERECSEFQNIPGFVIHCENLFVPPSEEPNILGYYCGVRNSPMSYDPQTGLIYMQGSDQLTWLWASSHPPTWDLGITEYLSSRVPDIHKQDTLSYIAFDPKTYKVVWKKVIKNPVTIYGSGGFITTAGGLAFHRMDDGNLIAFNAKNGDELWKFQTGVADSVLIQTATPMTYEAGGEQYVSIIMQDRVLAFKLGATMPQRPAPKLATVDPMPLKGPIQDAQVIRASVPNDFDYRHQLSPLKARVKAGSEITFLNNSAEPHTWEAVDGSWKTSKLLPREQEFLKIDKPGNYLYRCKDHPWVYGMLIVTDANTPATVTTNQPPINGAAAGVFATQADRGKSAYVQYCSGCHQSDLGGSDFYPALVGNAFTGRWQGKPAKDLLDKTRTTMPTNSPGSLSAQVYLDLVAYLMQVNGINRPTGLSADQLAGITLP